jgi:hypothetical protein
MRYFFALWLTLLSCLAEAQTPPIPVINNATTTASGFQVNSNVTGSGISMTYTVGAVTGGGSIVFTVCTLDPLNPSAGCIQSASSVSVSSAAGPASVVLIGPQSQSIKTSWAVTSTFSAAITLSVQGVLIPPDAGMEQIGDGGFCYFFDAGNGECSGDTTINGNLNVLGPYFYVPADGGAVCLDGPLGGGNICIRENAQANGIAFLGGNQDFNNDGSGYLSASGAISWDSSGDFSLGLGSIFVAKQYLSSVVQLESINDDSATAQQNYTQFPFVNHNLVEWYDGLPDAGDRVAALSPNGFLPPADDIGTPTNLYVSASGSDALSNNCATYDAGCLTLQGAYNRIPLLVEHQYVVTVEPGTFGCAYQSGWTTRQGNYSPSYYVNPSVIIQGTMGQFDAGPGVKTNGLVSTATEAGLGGFLGNNFPGPDGGWATVSVIDAGWPSPNGLTGQLFCVTSGIGSFECSSIATNTANKAWLAGGWDIHAPDGGSAFQIQTGLTTINTLCNFPGGGLGYPFPDAGVAGAALYVGNNIASGFRGGGGGIGFGSSGAYASIFSNVSFTDTPIVIQRFVFNAGDNGPALALTGPELVGFRWNQVNSGYGVQATGGASVYAIHNLYNGDTYGDPFVWGGGYNSDEADPAFALVYGNVALLQSSGGFNSLVSPAQVSLVVQNYVLGTGVAADAGTEMGELYGGNGTKLISIGNQFNYLGTGIQLAFVGQTGGFVLIDGDDFENVHDAALAQYGTQMLSRYDPITGNDCGVGFSISSAGNLVFQVREQITNNYIADFDVVDGVGDNFFSLSSLTSSAPYIYRDLGTLSGVQTN